MVFNLMFMAVGTGKFAEEFLPFTRWQSALIVFGVVGIYVTLGGFKGVILTDVFQTILIADRRHRPRRHGVPGSRGTCRSSRPRIPDGARWRPPGRSGPTMPHRRPHAYQHYYAFGPMLLAGFRWLIFRVLAGPNVWDFQFFLTRRSPRDASLAAGTWTVGYTLRWIIACAFLVLGIHYLGAQAGFDAEKIMPLVLKTLPIGLQGIFMAVLLAALMSTLSAMINVTSSVVTNDFLGRYFARKPSPQAARAARAAGLRRRNHCSASSSASRSPTSSPPGRP